MTRIYDTFYSNIMGTFTAIIYYLVLLLKVAVKQLTHYASSYFELLIQIVNLIISITKKN